MGGLLNLSFLLVDFTSKGVVSAFFNGWCKGKRGDNMKEFLELLKDNQLTFESLDEFYVKKNFIKEKYQSLDTDVKYLYKMYFFTQLCTIKNKYKEALWAFLNNNATYENANLIYIDFCNYRDNLFKKKPKEWYNISWIWQKSDIIVQFIWKNRKKGVALWS